MRLDDVLLLTSMLVGSIACAHGEHPPNGSGGSTGGSIGVGGSLTGGAHGGSGACEMEIDQGGTCDTCFHSACLPQCLSATGEPTSPAYRTCLQGCDDQTCYDGCRGQFPAAAVVSDSLDTCVETQCGSDCATCDMTIDEGGPCDTCFNAACLNECKAASHEPTITNYLNCIQDCSDQACSDGCSAQFPAAAALLGLFDTCVEASCAGLCLRS